MNLTTNDLFLLVKKQVLYNLNENKNPILPSISIKTRQDLLKEQKKEENYENYSKKIIMINESNIYNFIYNSINPKIIMCFDNLKYLSITNNYLNNLDFILRMPDLFYLDVFGNPIADFDSLNHIFGYLRLSVDKFHENKILNLSGLNCAILDIGINDKVTMKLFGINNPNILMINNEVNYYIDKISNIKNKTNKIKKLDQPKYLLPNQRNNNINLNDIKSAKYLSMNYIDPNLLNLNKKNHPETSNSSSSSGRKSEDDNNDDKYNINNSELLNKIKVEIKDKFLLNIKSYFEELNQILDKITQKVKRPISVSDLKNDNIYLNIEKKRLLLLYQTYLKLSIFNDEKKEGNYYSKNDNSINCNQLTDDIKIYEIKKYFKCININIRFGLMILIAILFYILNLISMKLAITIIHYILVKYYKFEEHKQIPNIKTFGNFHYLCYYIDNLEDFKYKLKFADKSQIELYKNILNILDNKKLILMSNFLKKKKEEYENKNRKDLRNENYSKNKVSSILMFIKEINLDKDIFVLIEFFCDFIKFEKMEQIVINGSFNDEYSSIIEIKEVLEQIELYKNTKDLSNEKYYKNKLERIFNKFYFENKKIKEVQNKNFQNFENEKMNPAKFNLLKFIMNWNKNYKKSDQISVKNCFTIDKIKIIKNDKKSDDNNSSKDYDKTYSNTKKFGYNICFSEGKKVINNSQSINFQTLNPNRSSNIYNTLKNFSKNKLNIKSHFNTINNRNNYRNRLIIKTFDNKIRKINIKSTLNILAQKDISINMSEKEELVNHKSKTFNQLFNYFVKGNRNNIKKFITERKDKKRNYFNNVESNYIQFPYGSNNREEAKIKIKKIENDTASINAQKLYSKNKYNKSRQSMNINKTYFTNELLVEKYDQKRLNNIISKIMNDKNKKIKQK